MKVLDPGHRYQLAILDAPTPLKRLAGAQLQFVKRIGDKYPGNKAPGCAGVTTQEVLRALIDRTKYVDAQRPSHYNTVVLSHLRAALSTLEMRAHDERGDYGASYRIGNQDNPETEPTCERCGHVFCQEKHA